MGRREFATGAGFFLVSAALRCVFVVGVSQHPAVLYPMLDSRSYHAKALQILAGEWLGDRIFYQDPLFPYFLAGLYAVFGVGSVGVLVAQAVLDAVTVLLIYLIAHRVFDYRCAVLAGLFATFYKPFFYYDALLLKVPLTVLLITLALLLFVVAVSRDRAGRWLSGGFALGLAALTRGNYLLFVPVLIAWVSLVSSGPARARLRRAALVAAGLSLAILPATLRNYVVGDDFVLITSQAGQNFFIGSFRGNDSGRYKPPPFVRANPFYEEEDFRSEAERRTGGHSLKPSELSRFWLRQGLEEIRSDPGHFLRHSALKARLFFNQYEVPATQSYYFFREHVAPILKVPAPGYGALLPLALCGMFFARRSREAQLLTLFFLTYAISVILTFNMSRYRMPVVPVVIVFAGVGLSRLVDLVARRRFREGAVVLGFLVVCSAFVHQDVARDNFAVNHLNLGIRHLDQAKLHRSRARRLTRTGDFAAARTERGVAAAHRASAEAQFRMGLDAQPDHPLLRRELASLLVSRVRELEEAAQYEEALKLAREVTATFPESADGHAILARVYSDLGRYPEARDSLQRALALSPEHPQANAELRLVNELDPPGERP